MSSPVLRLAGALAVSLFVTTTAVFADTNQPVRLQKGDTGKEANWKPVWLTEVSLAVREGYDNNVYRSGCNPKYLHTTYPYFSGPYGGSVAATRNHDSFFDSVTPKLAIDLAKLADPDSVLKTLAFSYAPEIVTYYDAPTESYTAHRMAATWIAKCDDLTFQLDEGFTYIDGDKYGPTYPGKWYSTPGQGVLRERRAQDQDRTMATLTYDQPDWFFRPTGSLLDYDLKTKQLSVPTNNVGYLNYVDRYDLNGGADVGYKVTKDFSATLGYRAGYQYQQKLPHAVDTYGQNASSDYQRLLLGFEGKPVSWLQAKVQAGPDFRNYNSHAPVRDDDQVAYYVNGSLSATLSPADTLALSILHQRWVASTGISPDDENAMALNYKHQINDQWSANLGFNAQSCDYSCGESWSTAHHLPPSAPTYYKNDWLFTYSAGVQYAVTSSLVLDVAYAISMGRNEQNLANLYSMPGTQLPASKREFDDNLVSVGAKYKF